ncbi:MAG TPA: hypothetical protein VGG19_04880 [Tepidisphaeraceae bacterium]
MSDDNLFGYRTAIGSFDNTTAHSIELKYTYVGDANLDGSVDGTDLSAWSNGVTNHLSGWQNGDFNYSGNIDSDDYAMWSLDCAFENEGKIDGSAAFDATDVTAFADALSAGSAAAFNTEYSGMGWTYSRADINGDGVVNSADIPGFDQIAADNGLSGYLNPAFGTDGLSILSNTGPTAYYAETTDANGNILATGVSGNHLIVSRYYPDGTLDSSFGTDGTTIIDASEWDLGYAVLVMPNGDILVGGRARVSGSVQSLMAMLNPDGSLDSSFGSDGVQITNLSSGYNVILGLALQPDGKIVATCYADNYPNDDVGLIRFNTDGSLDSSFGSDGIASTPLEDWDGSVDVTVLPDGSILTCGQVGGYMTVLKFASDGTPDDSFGTDGVASLGVAGGLNNMVVLSDGTIVLGGQEGGDNLAIAELNSDGSLNTDFGAEGFVSMELDGNSAVCGMIVQSYGQIVIDGYDGSSSTFIARFNADGSADNSFGNGGMTITNIGSSTDVDAHHILLQAGNGNYVVASEETNEFVLAEYNA